jgi:DNA-binding NarL/FixJ family response regulator
VRILLIDDHPLFRGGLKYLLRGLDESVETDESGDCAQALERLGAGTYDLVLLDLKLPGVNGLDALASLREAAPGTPLIVLSGEDDPEVVRASIERGAMGFIPKSSTPEVMIQALQLVLKRGVYLPPTVLDAVHAGGPAALPGLTPRQMDVMRCVIRGMPNKVIARELDVSEATVKAHLTAVFQALGARNRTEAVYVAAKVGLRLS